MPLRLVRFDWMGALVGARSNVPLRGFGDRAHAMRPYGMGPGYLRGASDSGMAIGMEPLRERDCGVMEGSREAGKVPVERFDRLRTGGLRIPCLTLLLRAWVAILMPHVQSGVLEWRWRLPLSRGERSASHQLRLSCSDYAYGACAATDRRSPRSSRTGRVRSRLGPGPRTHRGSAQSRSREC